MGNSQQMIRRVEEDEYEVFVKVKFPFKLTPIRDEARPGFVLLHAGDKVHHPTVYQGFVFRNLLAEYWLKGISTPKLESRLRLHFDASTSEDEAPKSGVKVTWLPVIEFQHSEWPLPCPWLTEGDLNLPPYHWYAVPQVTTPFEPRSFMVWAPELERSLMAAHSHSRGLQRLLQSTCHKYEKIMRIKIKGLDDAIRAVILQEIPRLPKELDTCCIAAFKALENHLQSGRVPRFLTPNLNTLHFKDLVTLERYHDKMRGTFVSLKSFKDEALTEERSGEVYQKDRRDSDEKVRINPIYVDHKGRWHELDPSDSSESEDESWSAYVLRMFDIIPF
ncbi:cyclic GMP-AMP synthase-like receptor [Drosophila bipectinata]|uniref:cyclic GMP-AMP synthase-like receptor n=1 Tax=Drosophila bipectinata TaxID=42026 RepID=UPI0038B3C5A8